MPTETETKTNTMPQTPVDPPLKWAGGKRWLVPFFAKLLPQFKIYSFIEPFCGAAAVTLGCRPQCSFISDINYPLINFYAQVQKGLKVDFDLRNEKEYYYEVRTKFNAMLKDPKHDREELALMFYYLNRTGFNGLCRFNNKGEYNVPFGRYRVIYYRSNFDDIRNALSATAICNCSYDKVPVTKDDDFVYADPPYDVEFTKYSARDFTWEDQVALANWLTYLPCPFVVSNSATPRILDLYRKCGFNMKMIDAPRRIAANGNRDTAFEVLASNVPI